MKKIISLFLSLVILLGNCSFEIYADSTIPYAVEGGNIYYTNNGFICYADKSITSAVIPSEINGVDITVIGAHAFRYCYDLANVSIPNSVTNIGFFAFLDCTSLTNIVIPNSITSDIEGAFINCTSLTNISIPNSMTNIGTIAFKNCQNLKSVNIPNSITDIHTGAFLDCNGIENVYYQGSEEEWNKIAISKDNECLINATIHYDNYTYTTNNKSENIKVENTEVSSEISYSDGSEKNHIDNGSDKVIDIDNINIIEQKKDNNDYLTFEIQMDDFTEIDDLSDVAVTTLDEALTLENYKIDSVDTAVETVGSVIDYINENEDIDDLAVQSKLTNFIDEAIGLSATADIPKDSVITKDFINTLENKAYITKYKMNNMLNEKGIELYRDTLTSITVKAKDKIQLSPDIDTLAVDNIHIDMVDNAGRMSISRDFVENNLTDEPLTLSFCEDHLMGDAIIGKFSTSHKLKTPITLSLSLIEKSSFDILNQISKDVDYFAVKGSDRYMVSMPNAVTDKIQFRTTDSGEYQVSYIDKLDFSDVVDLSNTQQDILRRLYARGVISGKSETLFEPNSTLTRAEFTTMLLKAIGKYDTEYKDNTGFVDMQNHWAASMVAVAKDMGVISGYDEDNTFRPDNNINNEQFYHILGITYTMANPKMQLNESLVDSIISNFNDSYDISQWAWNNIAITVSANIFVNSQSGNFNPKVDLTRLNAAMAMDNLFEILPFEGCVSDINGSKEINQVKLEFQTKVQNPFINIINIFIDTIKEIIEKATMSFDK